MSNDTDTTTLAAWLLACVDEDEAVARTNHAGHCGTPSEATLDETRERLRVRHFDGPHEIRSGGFDPIASMLGGGPVRYAICLVCGAMLRLDDHETRDDMLVERGVGKHMAFHRAHGDYESDLVS